MTNPFKCGPNPCGWTCRVPEQPCQQCFSPTPSQVGVLIPYSDSVCTNCDELATAVTLTQTATPCEWTGSGAWTCDTAGGTVEYTWYIQYGATLVAFTGMSRHSVWAVISTGETTVFSNYWTRYTSIIRNCSSELVIPFERQQINTTDVCAYPIYVTINPGDKDTGSCDTCIPEPATVRLRLSGFVSQLCTCVDLNGLEVDLTVNQRCEWISPFFDVTCGGVATPSRIYLVWGYDNHWVAHLNIGDKFYAAFSTGALSGCDVYGRLIYQAGPTGISGCSPGNGIMEINY